MKAERGSVRIKLTGLLAAVIVTLPACLSAQTATLLHSFTNNPDGNWPLCGLILSGNTLYGTATKGGAGAGIVFRVNTDGTCFTNLHSFPATGAGLTNIGGAFPSSALVLSGNMLYGTTLYGGTSGNGAVYALDTGGMNFTNLHDFSALVSLTNSDGATPEGELVLSGGTLFGTAYAGGPSLDGVLFSVSTNGTGFTNLYSFSPAGGAPQGGVVLSGNTLYGEGLGYLFRISTNGTAFTNLYVFSTETTSGNSDGAELSGYLTVSGNTLYGIAQDGGTANDGTIFRIDTGGKGFANLHNFKGADGAYPVGGLLLTNNVLYGLADGGGPAQNGTIFQFNLSNSNLVTLYHFPATLGTAKTNSVGASPGGEDCVVLGSSSLYGTTGYGGTAGDGTVMALTLPTPPQLFINGSGPIAILSWSTNAANFILQSTTNLVLGFWNNVSPAPVVVNLRDTVTNPVSGRQMFYRLSQ